MSEEAKLPDARLTRIEEGGTTFPLLTLTQIEAVEQAVRKDLLRHFTDIADAAGLVPAERYALMKQDVPDTVELDDLFAWTRSARGIRRVLTESIGDKPEIIETFGGLNGANMALAVMGFAKRITPAEIEKRQQDVTDRMFGLAQQEEAYAKRKAALERAESGEDEPREPDSSPPGGGSASE